MVELLSREFALNTCVLREMCLEMVCFQATQVVTIPCIHHVYSVNEGPELGKYGMWMPSHVLIKYLSK